MSKEGDLHRDKYKNFDQLRRHEREGVDFVIRRKRQRASVAIIAPHGGKIEPGTSEIAAAIAADIYSLYCFEGIKKRMNRNLHITSTNFDEPQCLKLVARSNVVVAVHGRGGARRRIDVGGRDTELRTQISTNLRDAGFNAGVVTHGRRAGTSPRNVCNRGRSGAGAQLEVTRCLRNALYADRRRLRIFAHAVQTAIEARAIKET
jgi:phage replication-related protein YjqB (UPF0714/DUF867 family)